MNPLIKFDHIPNTKQNVILVKLNTKIYNDLQALDETARNCFFRPIFGDISGDNGFALEELDELERLTDDSDGRVR